MATDTAVQPFRSSPVVLVLGNRKTGGSILDEVWRVYSTILNQKHFLAPSTPLQEWIGLAFQSASRLVDCLALRD